MRSRVLRARCSALLLAVALPGCGGSDDDGDTDGGVTGASGEPVAALRCERDKHVKVAFTSPSAVANPTSGPLQAALVDVGFTARVDNGSGACSGNFGDVLPEAQRPSCTANCAPAPSFESYPYYQLVEHTR